MPLQHALYVGDGTVLQVRAAARRSRAGTSRRVLSLGESEGGTTDEFGGSIMAASNFNTSNQTYRQLVGNGLIYSVPRFQRDYSWEEEHWDDLWRDIQG